MNNDNNKDCHRTAVLDVDAYNNRGSNGEGYSSLAPPPLIAADTAHSSNIISAFFADLFEERHRRGRASGGGSGSRIAADTIATIEIVPDNAKLRSTAQRSVYFPSLKQDKERKSINRWHSIDSQNQSHNQNRGQRSSSSSMRLSSQLLPTVNSQTVEGNGQQKQCQHNTTNNTPPRRRLSTSLSPTPPSRRRSRDNRFLSPVRRIEKQIASSVHTFIKSDFGMMRNDRAKIINPATTQRNQNEIDRSSAHSSSSFSSAGSLHWEKFSSSITTVPYVLRSQHTTSSSSSSTPSLSSSSRRDDDDVDIDADVDNEDNIEEEEGEEIRQLLQSDELSPTQPVRRKSFEDDDDDDDDDGEGDNDYEQDNSEQVAAVDALIKKIHNLSAQEVGASSFSTVLGRQQRRGGVRVGINDRIHNSSKRRYYRMRRKRSPATTYTETRAIRSSLTHTSPTSSKVITGGRPVVNQPSPPDVHVSPPPPPPPPPRPLQSIDTRPQTHPASRYGNFVVGGNYENYEDDDDTNAAMVPSLIEASRRRRISNANKFLSIKDEIFIDDDHDNDVCKS